ncbi:hypothetical protein [Paenibacillus sp. WLX2291]|uniref:hypothetical protein n=1 Tax=Paenibacillus sp. WLX2291 TaxID=3296934 RepID=UPI003984131E
MTTTLFYKGTLKSHDDKRLLLEKVKTYAEKKHWYSEYIDTEEGSGLRVNMHPDSEQLNFVFDSALYVDEFVKVGVVPEGLYLQVIELIYSLKPHFKNLNVLDESDEWEKYVESQNPRKRKPFVYDEVQLNDMQKQGVADWVHTPEPAANWLEIDYTFWCIQEQDQLSFQVICNKIRQDLSRGYDHLLTINELKELAIREHDLYFEDRTGIPELVIISLIELWVLKRTTILNRNPKMIKQRGIILGSILSNAFFGFFGGWIDRTYHKEAQQFLEMFIQNNEDSSQPLPTLTCFYSLLALLQLEET